MKFRRTVFSLASLAAMLALSAYCPAYANTIWYVRADAQAGGNGLSWGSAFRNLDLALAAGSALRDAQGLSDEIWVAQGLYIPPFVGTHSSGFVINKPFKIYGGFKGTETSSQVRSGFLKTILDGQAPAPSFAKADHVLMIQSVLGTSTSPGVLIDGFLIRNGSNFDGLGGGGIYSAGSDLDLANCYLRHNIASGGGFNGGGLYFTSIVGTGWPVQYPEVSNILHVKNCEFSDNWGVYGGGLYGDYLRGDIVNTRFLDNTVNVFGGGVYLTRMGSTNQLSFANCIFWENFCSTAHISLGGGMYLDESGGGSSTASNATLVNCTFSNNDINSLADGSALGISTNSLATIHNSILYYNGNGSFRPITGPATVTYSDVYLGWSGVTNIDVNPEFADHDLGRLNLLLTPTASPCLDRADYSKLPADTLDLDGDGNVAEPIPLDADSATRLLDQLSINDLGVGSTSGPYACPSCTYLDMGALERQ